MSNQPTAFPPPVPTGTPRATMTSTPPPPPGRLRHPVALFAVAAGLGLVAAIVVGFGTGALVMVGGNADCSPSDGWCELGGAIAGLFVGFLFGAIAYIVAGTVTIVRCRPAGTRQLHVLAHLAFPFAVILTGMLLDTVIW